MMISVVIPTFRAPEKLARCQQHLAAQTIPVDIYVRDNSDDNILFTAAINEGLRHFLRSDNEAVLILNQDMYLAPDCIEQMWRFMQSHPRCGIAGPIELIANHPQQLAYGGGLQAFPWGISRVEPADELAYDEKVHWLNGACMLFRREMVEEIGLLDRNMKFLCSDADYCFTARSRGWQAWRVGAARGEHEHGGASRPTENSPLEQQKVKDALFFGQKWLTGDIFRKLAWEGEQLTPDVVNAQMKMWRSG
ncbi:MAG: glycosyltransferase family 2 protein [Gammaproteobacteria bacterium]|nr:glycosyltransferase family 2 protein [Gammaproteobacteria bacterium]